jgi:diguanylate cyclase (GGDEF)-like protein
LLPSCGEGNVTGASAILRSYVGLVRRLSGAASVSLYVPPGPAGESEILVHDGRLEPLPELADPQTAAEFQQQAGPGATEAERGAVRLASRCPGGVLCRIPLRWVMLGGTEEAAGPERRRRESPRNGLVAWIGLRFERAEPAARDDGSPWVPQAVAATLSDERWWREFLGVAAAFAAHSRALSRSHFDQVTGLPDRTEFQTELELALARAVETGRLVVLLLLGPDDFGWVNERLDRRSGDLVLREIAAELRAGLRGHDHVARYGGAIFAVILVDTPLEDSRIVAENVLRRLGEQRYHGGILRLEFSAGVAVAVRTEPIDAHELIRRADQALSAAKRGSAGSVRVWEKGSDVEHARSLDRLLGIFTGDKSTDYRNMSLLLDSVAAGAAAADPAELAGSFTRRLFETLHARRVGAFERTRQGGFELLGGLERAPGGTEAFHVTEQDLAVLQRACDEGNFVALGGGEGPGEIYLCALPLALPDRCLGGIVLEVGSLAVSFEGSDRKFLDALASEMAVALDRVRLIERERERQREEKERLEAEVTDLRRVVHGSRLAYRSAAIESVLATARKVAHTDTTVLITGESGTGKEMLASTLHELSGRHERAMVVVDCSAISPTLIESELFGHERGAFTGAHARKRGRFAEADRSTVFLDEVGDLPLDLQSKLLRFVQDKQLTPVGGVTPQTLDVRIIAATNADLEARVAEGRFRPDLFHRLNVVRLHVPPLRERREDIVHLANVFLKQFAALYRRPAHHFTTRAEEALEAYAWPGNVRELQNLVLTSVLFCEAPEVDVEDLQGLPLSAGAGAVPGPASIPRPVPGGGGAEEAGAAASPEAGLRSALAEEIALARASGRPALPPLGKWLAEDLVLAADRLSGGVSRRGADLLGIAETTYRRKLRSATACREAGLVVRSQHWPAVTGVLEALIRARAAGTDVCQWAEASLLAEIEVAAPGDTRTSAALLGVTEPTLLRRKAASARRS